MQLTDIVVVLLLQYTVYANCFDVSTLTGLDVKKVDKCMGDPNADSDHPLLKMEQDAQVKLLNITWFVVEFH